MADLVGMMAAAQFRMLAGLTTLLGQPYDGLSVAARAARRQKLISNRSMKACVRVDITAHALRHAQELRLQKLVEEVEKELVGARAAKAAKQQGVGHETGVASPFASPGAATEAKGELPDAKNEHGDDVSDDRGAVTKQCSDEEAKSQAEAPSVGCMRGGQEFIVEVSKSDGNDKLAVDLDVTTIGLGPGLRIEAIKEGLVMQWNRAHPGKQVLVGDYICEVNGVPANENIEKTCSALSRCSDLKLLVKRGQPPQFFETGRRLERLASVAEPWLVGHPPACNAEKYKGKAKGKGLPD